MIQKGFPMVVMYGLYVIFVRCKSFNQRECLLFSNEQKDAVESSSLETVSVYFSNPKSGYATKIANFLSNKFSCSNLFAQFVLIATLYCIKLL